MKPPHVLIKPEQYILKINGYAYLSINRDICGKNQPLFENFYFLHKKINFLSHLTIILHILLN